MALIKCPECGQAVSDSAKKCPHCGYSLKGLNTNGSNVGGFQLASLLMQIGALVLCWVPFFFKETNYQEDAYGIIRHKTYEYSNIFAGTGYYVAGKETPLKISSFASYLIVTLLIVSIIITIGAIKKGKSYKVSIVLPILILAALALKYVSWCIMIYYHVAYQGGYDESPAICFLIFIGVEIVVEILNIIKR